VGIVVEENKPISIASVLLVCLENKISHASRHFFTVKIKKSYFQATGSIINQIIITKALFRCKVSTAV
jgi:hypothetical protein